MAQQVPATGAARPRMLRSRPLPAQVVLVILVPAAFGAVTGWALGESKPAYIALSIVAAIGGFLAGFEHPTSGEAAIRGLIAGATFGGAILIVHHATGKHPTVKLPDTEEVLIAFTAGIGAILAAFGTGARASLEREREPFSLDVKRLHWSELVGFLGAAILLGSLWLHWFGTNPSNPNAKINGLRGTFTGWETFRTLDVLLAAACAAPLILAWIIARGHELTWRPGEVTMIVGITAAVLILLNGIVLGKPGSPDSDISMKVGWYVGLVGALVITAGGILRQAQLAHSRKPPGVM